MLLAIKAVQCKITSIEVIETSSNSKICNRISSTRIQTSIEQVITNKVMDNRQALGVPLRIMEKRIQIGLLHQGNLHDQIIGITA